MAVAQADGVDGLAKGSASHRSTAQGDIATDASGVGAKGRATGSSRLLVEVAVRLRAALRSGDTAARVGGDEFVALLDEVANERAALRVAERDAKAQGGARSVLYTKVRHPASGPPRRLRPDGEIVPDRES